MSSVTKIWPSQYLDAPIPIVGMEIEFVIFFANLSNTHSMTMANTPDFDKDFASSKIICSCEKLLPCIFLDILEETNLNSAIRFLTPMETQHSI